MTVYFFDSLLLASSPHPNLTLLLSYTSVRSGEFIPGMLLWSVITFMIYSVAKMLDQVSVNKIARKMIVVCNLSHMSNTLSQ